MMSGQVPEDKLNQLNERIQEMTFDTDSAELQHFPGWERFRCASSSVRNRNVSNLKRSNSPIHLNLWIQLLPTSETACKMKLTVGADLNPFIKGMVAKPLKEGVEKLADMLAMIPYGA